MYRLLEIEEEIEDGDQVFCGKENAWFDVHTIRGKKEAENAQAPIRRKMSTDEKTQSGSPLTADAVKLLQEQGQRGNYEQSAGMNFKAAVFSPESVKEQRGNYETMGIKHDDSKPRWDLLPLDQVEKIVKVLTFGAKKYKDNNWKNVTSPKRRYLAALMRHLTFYQKGKFADDESGLSHLAHAGCCLIFLLWFEDNFVSGDRELAADIEKLFSDES